MKTKVYFACSITNSSMEMREENRKTVEILNKHFQLLTPHFASEKHFDDDIIKQLEPWEHIYERDVATIRSADMIIAEVTNPSTGVGYEIGLADGLGKPIICLFRCMRDGDEKRLTAMIKGNRNIKVILYTSADDLRRKIKEIDA